MLTSDSRISSLDIFRAVAIIVVVFYHFHQTINFGKIGVDLFFVISGFLVGGILIREYDKNEGIHVSRFILQRGFKIWPSFFFLIFGGSVMAWFFYHQTHPEQLIRLRDFPKYIFFYMNYAPYPEHFSFDHSWSLCVEEHFYIILPVSLFLIQKFSPLPYRKRNLYAFVFTAIILGFLFKVISLYFTESRDTYLSTHNRIDALAWGVLLYLVIADFGHKLKEIKWLYLVSLAALFLIGVAIYLYFHVESEKYHKILFHSALPPLFFCLILGVYFRNFHKRYLLRGIGYFSYNWYLWHPIFVLIISDRVGTGIAGLLTYLAASLSMAILSTLLIEEPVLRKRKAIMDKIFRKEAVLEKEKVALQ